MTARPLHTPPHRLLHTSNVVADSTVDRLLELRGVRVTARPSRMLLGTGIVVVDSSADRPLALREVV